MRQTSWQLPRLRWADDIRETLLVGLCAGIAYFLLDVILFFPSEELRLMGSGLLKANLFIYSLSVWVCGFTALCGIVQILTVPLCLRSAGGKRPSLKRFIVLFVVIMFFVTGHAVWAYYAQSPPFQPRYIIFEDMKLILLAVILSSALLALAVSLAASRNPIRLLFARRRGTRPLLAVIGFCLVYLMIANLVGMAGHWWDKDKSQLAAGNKPIVLFGIDCGSWNVMLPFLENGDLPGFKKIMEEGSYGYLDTYGIVGRALTPPSWTTIATGKTMEEHGISRFGQLSSDWRAAPIWTILSRAGKKVGVVDWVCAWPPFKVNGMFISNSSPSRLGRTYFSPGYDSLSDVAESIIVASYRGVPAGEGVATRSAGSDMGFVTRTQLAAYAQSEMGFLSRIEKEVFSRCPLDLVSYYCYCTDPVQHMFWKDIDPTSLRHGDWEEGQPDSTNRDIVKWVWMAADTLLTNLMARYGDDAYYFVVSDHGARRVQRRTSIFRMNTLLREMGYLKLKHGEVDSSASICFVTETLGSFSRFDLEVNPAHYKDADQDRIGSFRDTVSRIADELRSIRVKETGDPIFERVDVRATMVSGDEPDMMVFASKNILRMPDKEKTIVVGAKEIDLRSLLSVHPWLAHHRARGIILVKGPGVRRRYCGSWTIVDPYVCIFPYLREIVRATGSIDPVLRGLHILDGATTLDVAPTLLYLADLPISEDMDGKVLTELIDAPVMKARPIKKVATYEVGSVVDRNTSTIDHQEIKQTLKALGYLQ
ncbi:MAG: alkaline phosphatase family protein [Candidatus Eisenbacteria bacterium]